MRRGRLSTIRSDIRCGSLARFGSREKDTRRRRVSDGNHTVGKSLHERVKRETTCGKGALTLPVTVTLLPGSRYSSCEALISLPPSYHSHTRRDMAMVHGDLRGVKHPHGSRDGER